eukprot:COSAG06_NODE_264_length_18850_cov_2499.951848_3_plen_61_part_00
MVEIVKQLNEQDIPVLTSPHLILPHLMRYYVTFRMIEYSDHPIRLDSRDVLMLGSRNLFE